MIPEEQNDGLIEASYGRSLATEKSADQIIAEYERDHGVVETSPDPTVSPDPLKSGDMQDTGGGDIGQLPDLLKAVPAGVSQFVEDAFNGGKDVVDFARSRKLTPEQRKKERFDFTNDIFGQPQSLPSHATKAAAEFITGFGVAMKATPFLPAAGALGAASMLARGALTDFIMTDPESGNISRILMDHGLKNPVIDFLASDPKDPAIEIRLKGALEGAIPGALIPPFVSALKWYKARGLVKEAEEVAAKAAPTAAGTVETPGAAPSAPPKPDVLPKAPSIEEQQIALLAKDLGVTPAEAKKRLVVVGGKPQDFARVTGEDVGKFMEIVQDGKKPAALRLNLPRMSGEKDIQKALAATEQVFSADIEKMVGSPVSWAQTEKEAKELFGDISWIGDLQESAAANRKKIAAAKILVNTSAKTVFELNARAVKEGTDVARAALLRGLETHAAIQAQFSGARSEMGRGLNVMAAPMEAIADSNRAKALELIIKAGGGRSNVDEFMKTLEDVGKSADPVVMAKFLSDWRKLSQGGRIVEGLMEARRGLMLTGVGTNILNVGSNAMNIPVRIIEKGLAERVAKRAGVSPMSKSLTDSVAQGEALAEVNGLIAGLMDGLVLAKNQIKGFQRPTVSGVSKAIRAGATDPFPMATIAEENFNRFSWGSMAPENKNTRELLETLQLDHAVNAIGAVSRTGFNVMGGADDLFKAINYRMGVHAAAHREATRLGLEGAERASLIKDLVQQPIPDVAEEGLADSLKWTFNSPLNGNYARADEIVKNNRLLRFMLPFTRTNFNVFDYTLQNLPLARNMSNNLINDLKAGGTRAQMAKARVQMGNMAVMLGAGLAASGLLRGAGAPDPKTRKAQGWDQYSIKVGDNWIGFGRSHPLAKVLGMGADIYEMVGDLADGKEDRAGDIAMVAAALGMHGVTPEFMVQTMGDFIEAYEAKDTQKFTKFLNRTLNPLAFTGAVRDATRLLDPTKRDTTGEPVTAYNDNAARAWDEAKDLLLSTVPDVPIMNKLVPTSKTLYPQLDLFGDEVEWNPGITGITVSAAKADPVKEEILGLRLTDDMIADVLTPGEKDIALQLPARTLTNGGTVRELTPEQYHSLVLLSAGLPAKGQSTGMGPLKKSLAKLMEQPLYKSSTDNMKRVLIRDLVSANQAAARGLLPKLHPELNQDLIDNIKKRGGTLTPKRGPSSTRYPTVR